MRLSREFYNEDLTKTKEVLHNIIKENKDNLVVVCIGTDRVIGDSLGPIVGTMLENNNFKYSVYGTLNDPIHALNIREKLNDIYDKHEGACIIGIDACLGSKRSIGEIKVNNRPLSPGKGVGKNLPKVGDYSILGIVDEYFADNKFKFNNNVRLSFVLELAEAISLSILYACDIIEFKQIV